MAGGETGCNGLYNREAPPIVPIALTGSGYMTKPIRMKFGVFMAPFHRVGENPTLALERDLELLQWLDVLGFDEAYIGEHHSSGWEIICAPEVFIATAAERTRHIR